MMGQEMANNKEGGRLSMIDRAYLEQVKAEAEALSQRLWSIEEFLASKRMWRPSAAIWNAANELDQAANTLKELSREGGNADATQAVLGEIEAERRRQIEVEGWSPERDDATHPNGELSYAAACYARGLRREYQPGEAAIVPRDWPWHPRSWKPTTRRRNLIKAAALIVAEIERLDRKEKRG